MDDAGIDVQILSYAPPSAERLEPSLARELTRQANDTLAAAVSKHPDRFLGFATLIDSREGDTWKLRMVTYLQPYFFHSWPPPLL